MDHKELKRLFNEDEQRKYEYGTDRLRNRTRLVVHPLVKLRGLDRRIGMERESNYIRAQVEEEIKRDGGNPIGRLLLNLKDGELMFRYRIDKEAFQTKEVFEKVCEHLAIDPKSAPIQPRSEGECWWFSKDNKSCLWCAEDPRHTDDYYPRYFEFTGLRSRVCEAGDYTLHAGIGELGNLGSLVVWQDAPWWNRSQSGD